jgi:hypothetical protein
MCYHVTTDCSLRVADKHSTARRIRHDLIGVEDSDVELICKLQKEENGGEEEGGKRKAVEFFKKRRRKFCSAALLFLPF